MRAAVAALPLLALGAGCATPREPATLGVAEVVERHRELDGHIVRVRGWLSQCHGRACAIYGTLAGARGEGAGKEWLSIGPSPVFDRKARLLRHAQIVLEGRLRAVCFNDPMPAGIVEVCADRVGQLLPLRIVSTIQRAAAP